MVSNKFKLSVFIILLITSQLIQAEVDVVCGDIKIGSMGLAWSKIDGKLLTGTVVCNIGSKEIRTPYLNGFNKVQKYLRG